MSSKILEPRKAWILSHIQIQAQQYGGVTSKIQGKLDGKRGKLCQIIAIRDKRGKEHPDAAVWADVSDGQHFIPAKFTAEAVRCANQKHEVFEKDTKNIISLTRWLSQVARAPCLDKPGMESESEPCLLVEEFSYLAHEARLLFEPRKVGGQIDGPSTGQHIQPVSSHKTLDDLLVNSTMPPFPTREQEDKGKAPASGELSLPVGIYGTSLRKKLVAKFPNIKLDPKISVANPEQQALMDRMAFGKNGGLLESSPQHNEGADHNQHAQTSNPSSPSFTRGRANSARSSTSNEAADWSDSGRGSPHEKSVEERSVTKTRNGESSKVKPEETQDVVQSIPFPPTPPTPPPQTRRILETKQQDARLLPRTHLTRIHPPPDIAASQISPPPNDPPLSGEPRVWVQDSDKSMSIAGSQITSQSLSQPPVTLHGNVISMPASTGASIPGQFDLEPQLDASLEIERTSPPPITQAPPGSEESPPRVTSAAASRVEESNKDSPIRDNNVNEEARTTTEVPDLIDQNEQNLSKQTSHKRQSPVIDRLMDGLSPKTFKKSRLSLEAGSRSLLLATPSHYDLINYVPEVKSRQSPLPQHKDPQPSSSSPAPSSRDDNSPDQDTTEEQPSRTVNGSMQLALQTKTHDSEAWKRPSFQRDKRKDPKTRHGASLQQPRGGKALKPQPSLPKQVSNPPDIFMAPQAIKNSSTRSSSLLRTSSGPRSLHDESSTTSEVLVKAEPSEAVLSNPAAQLLLSGHNPVFELDDKYKVHLVTWKDILDSLTEVHKNP